jgi:hypothetical protein
MDWIERMTGMSPDGGSGTLELLWLFAVLAAFLVARLLKSRVFGDHILRRVRHYQVLEDTRVEPVKVTKRFRNARR